MGAHIGASVKIQMHNKRKTWLPFLRPALFRAGYWFCFCFFFVCGSGGTRRILFLSRGGGIGFSGFFKCSNLSFSNLSFMHGIDCTCVILVGSMVAVYLYFRSMGTLYWAAGGLRLGSKLELCSSIIDVSFD